MILRAITLLLCVLGSLGFSASLPAAVSAALPIERPARLDLTLLHDNDLHGHILPFPYTEKERSRVEEPSRGGAARRSTLVHRLRKAIHNPVMLIDSGDIATRGPFATAYEGLADVESMNALGYDLAAIGNNEFKLKDGVASEDSAGAKAALLRLIKRSRFPWIAANASDEKGCFLEGVQPFVVREVDGIRVGFLGLTAPRSAAYPQVKGWTISDPVDSARHWIPLARQQCDILIAVTHIGTILDVLLARETRGIDAIVGGDSHTFLYKAVEAKNLDGAVVPIVQDGEFGADLGRFDLHFLRGPDARYRLVSYQYQLIPIGPNIPADHTVERRLAPYVAPLMVPVGTLERVGGSEDERNRLTAELVSRAMRAAAAADAALNPPGGGFFESFRRRRVTPYDVYAVMPFQNDIVTASLSASELKALLAANPTTASAGIPAAFEDGRTYRVAMVDYEAGSVYHLRRDQYRDTGVDVRDSVISYLKSGKS